MDRGGPRALMVRPETRPEESRALTGLRGLAATLVMLHHFYLNLALDQHMPMLQWLLRRGYLGVDLFFVLSGFVMTMVYGTWFGGLRSIGSLVYLRFMARRVARLWPVHAVVLLFVLTAYHLPVSAAPTPRLVLANFAMVQAWGSSAELNPPAWSVSTEFAAYLLFPVLATVSARGRWGPVLCAAGAAASLACCLILAPPLGLARRGWLDVYFNYSMLPLLRCLAGFTIGMLAFRAGQQPVLRRLAALPGLAPLVAVLFVGSLLGRVNDLLILPMLPVLVLALHFGRGRLQSALSRNPLHALGLLSYAIYLVHYELLGLFPFGAAPLRELLPVYLLVTLGVAGALYWLVEEPGRRMIRAVAEATLRAVAPAAAARRPLQDGPP